ncbi:MAG: L-2-amino-thiazoline-4-carboxylic acid hydrolase [Candidatus Heimdallarchaeota archaeon]
MVKTISTYKENTRVKFKLKDLIIACLNGLELFLKDLKENRPESLKIIIEDLTTQYGKNEDFRILIPIELNILNENPELVKASINAVLSLVSFKKYSQNSINDEIDIDAIDLITTFNQFEYLFMISLLKIMSREEAIDYIKRLADDVAHSRNDPKNYVNNLQELLDRYKTNLERWCAQDITADFLNERKLMYKVKKCVWAEVLKGFDHELSYSMMCYQDFENTKNQNPNFVLTRTKTIMQGFEYCDFCYHDTRKESEIVHPSVDIWKKLD